jgi:hypothetical protein
VSTTLVANFSPVSTTPAANFATSSPCAVDIGGKFATGVNDTSGKFAAGVNDAGGKLTPVSTTPARIMRTISGCRHLKVNLKAKIYIYVNSTTQRCPNKIIKIFLLEDFFDLPPVALTPVVHLEPRISQMLGGN